jgi:hypothetical protein
MDMVGTHVHPNRSAMILRIVGVCTPVRAADRLRLPRGRSRLASAFTKS